jgi:hypothetical protein
MQKVRLDLNGLNAKFEEKFKWGALGAFLLVNF